MAYMCRLLRGAVLGQEAQCLKGLSLQDHMVVVPHVVQVIINMTLDLMVVAFSPIVLADHIFPHMVLAFLKWDMACLVFSQHFFRANEPTLVSFIVY
jgi:hypothetical protein